MKEKTTNLSCSYCGNGFQPTLGAEHNDLFGHTICPKCFAAYAHFRERADSGDTEAKRMLSQFSTISRNLGAAQKERDRIAREEERKKEEEERERKDREAMDQMMLIAERAKALKGDHDA